MHDADATARRKREALDHHRRGALAEALAAYRDVLAASPDDREALLMAGRAMVEAGRPDQAIGPLAHLTRIDPAGVAGWNALAMAQQAAGQPAQAEASLARALTAAPGHPESHNLMGVVQAALGRAERAESHFRQALAAAPDYHGAHLNLGRLLAGRGDLDGAIQGFSHALRTNPRSPQAHALLLQALMRRGALHAAVPVLEGWIALEPGNAGPRLELAGILTGLGEYDRAGAQLDVAARLAPDHPALRVKRAELLEKRGERQAAWEQIAPLLAEGAPSAEAALVFGALAPHLDKAREAAALVDRAVAERWNPALEGQLRHKAGDLYDRLGEYDVAFERFRAGNDFLAAVGEPFDPDGHDAWVDRIVAAYGAGCMRALARADAGRHLPVFIVGMPRSGTSLVEQIIASHPQAHGAGELIHIKDIANQLARGCNAAYPELAPVLTAEEAEWGAEAYEAKLRALSADARRITDKMPNNAHYLGLIAQLFPGARVIHTRRDPLDTCLSCYFQSFPGLPYTRDLGHLGRFHNACERLMAHWKEVLDLPILTVRYEDLVADQERVSRELIAFCGLEWDDACLSFHKTRRAVATASYDQVRQPIYDRSVGRWRHYEKHLGPLRAALEQK